MSIELETRVRRLSERVEKIETLGGQVEEIERLVAELQDEAVKLAARVDKLDEWAPKLVQSIGESDAERRRDIAANERAIAEIMAKRKPGRPRKHEQTT